MSSRSSLKQWLAPFRIALVIAFVIAFILGLAAPRLFASGKLSLDERIELERGLSSEIANAKMQLPRSKKALNYSSDGHIDDAAWQKAQREFGIAARVGDQIQITRVVIEADKILLEINGGLKGGHRWYDHIQVSAPIGASYPTDQNANSNAASGSLIALTFKGGVPSIKSSDVKQILAPLFDFDKHTATGNYVEQLPAPIQKAIKEQHAVEGMDREQVLLAMGKPRSKSRETKDGDELEDWIYGDPPGKITFVTFAEGKVVKIREAYANIGGSTAPPLDPR
jgi:hypothetical protein